MTVLDDYLIGVALSHKQGHATHTAMRWRQVPNLDVVVVDCRCGAKVELEGRALFALAHELASSKVVPRGKR